MVIKLPVISAANQSSAETYGMRCPVLPARMRFWNGGPTGDIDGIATGGGLVETEVIQTLANVAPNRLLPMALFEFKFNHGAGAATSASDWQASVLNEFRVVVGDKVCALPVWLVRYVYDTERVDWSRLDDYPINGLGLRFWPEPANEHAARWVGGQIKEMDEYQFAHLMHRMCGRSDERFKSRFGNAHGYYAPWELMPDHLSLTPLLDHLPLIPIAQLTYQKSIR